MDSQTLKTITRLEECLWQSETRFDVHLMCKTFAEDVFEIGLSGRTFSRKDLLSEMDPMPFNATLPLQTFQARHLAPDVVLVTYISEMILDSITKKAKRSSIWSYNDGAWRLRFHHGTPLSD